VSSEFVSGGDDLGGAAAHDRAGRDDRASGYLRRLRSVRLLEQVLSSRAMTADELASALVVPRDTVDAYRRGETLMPLERQLCLALLVIERVPQLARQAYRLRGQVLAEAAFHARATKTHMIAPVSKHWR
jgi:hypothetical protein